MKLTWNLSFDYCLHLRPILELKCDLKAVCSIKRKNGALPIPEVPEQEDFLMRFPKSGMRGSEEAVWAMSSFFFLADFILVFQLSFPSTPCPQESVTTP